MPEFSNRDRLCIMAEQTMWTVSNLLGEESRSLDNEFGRKIGELHKQASVIAKELRDYNDQFENEDD